MAAVQSNLSAYLEASSRLPWVWGERDCALWVANFVLSIRGTDPGATWRGKYRTRLGCERLLKNQGGLAQVMSLGAAACGLPSVDTASTGNVGVIMAPVMRRGKISLEHTGAIKTATGWAHFTANGIVVFQAKAVAAWSL